MHTDKYAEQGKHRDRAKEERERKARLTEAEAKAIQEHQPPLVNYEGVRPYFIQNPAKGQIVGVFLVHKKLAVKGVQFWLPEGLLELSLSLQKMGMEENPPFRDIQVPRGGKVDLKEKMVLAQGDCIVVRVKEVTTTASCLAVNVLYQDLP